MPAPRSSDLPTKHGTDLFPYVTKLPTETRVHTIASKDWLQTTSNAVVQELTNEIIQKNYSWIMHFLNGQRMNHYAGQTEYSSTKGQTDFIQTRYINNMGVETFDIYAYPEAYGGVKGKKRIQLPDEWLIGTDDRTTFFWWDTLKPSTTYNNSIDYWPAYFKEVHISDGSDSFPEWPAVQPNAWKCGVYNQPLDGKIYWEVEIVEFPAGLASKTYAFGGNSIEGELYESPARNTSFGSRTIFWPDGAAGFWEPQIGLVPEGTFEIDTANAENDGYKTYTVQPFLPAWATQDMWNLGPDARPLMFIRSFWLRGPTHTRTRNADGWYVSVTANADGTGPSPGTDFPLGINMVGPDGTHSYYSGETSGYGGAAVYEANRGNDYPGYDGNAPRPPTFSVGTWDSYYASTLNLLDWPAAGNVQWHRPRIEGELLFRVWGSGFTTVWRGLSDPRYPGVTPGGEGTLHYSGVTFTDSYSTGTYGDEHIPSDRIPDGFGYTTQNDGFYMSFIKGCVQYSGYTRNGDGSWTPTVDDPDLETCIWTGVERADPQVGDIFMFCVDTETRNVWVGINGEWPNGEPGTEATAVSKLDGTDTRYYAFAGVTLGSCWVKMRFGAATAYAAPGGFEKLVDAGSYIELDEP